MATVKFISVPTKRLAASINASSTSIKVSDILGWDGVDLTASDFGTKMYCVLRNDSNTQMEIMELDPSTIASASITILLRGLKFNGDLTTEVTANKLTWVKNETLVELGTDVPQLLEHTVRTVGDQTIAGVKTFSSAPISSSDASSADELVRKSQLDAAAFGTLVVSPVVMPGTAGETLLVDQTVYLKISDGRWWLLDADTAATVENIILGITRGGGTAGNAITNGVTILGEHTAASAIFTANTKYYCSNTAGGFSTSAGTNEVTLGYARTTTKFFLYPRYDQQLTEDQQDALVGSSGTPSASNKFVTAADTNFLNPVGLISPYAGFTAPTGWLLADGSAVSRSTYADLFGVLNPSLGTVTVTIASPGVFTLTSHGLVLDDIVYLTTTGALPTGLSANTPYYVISAGLTADNFELSATKAGSAINTSGSQSGVHTIRRSPYGVGDGSTTFNVPNLKAKTVFGRDSTDTSFNAVGETGGAKTTDASTSTPTGATQAINLSGGGGNGYGYSSSNPNITTGSSSAAIIPPYIALNYIIKT